MYFKRPFNSLHKFFSLHYISVSRDFTYLNVLFFVNLYFMVSLECFSAANILSHLRHWSRHIFYSLVLFLKFHCRTHVSCLICHSRMTYVGGDSSSFHCFSELLTFTQNVNKSTRRSLLKIALFELKEEFSFKVYFFFFYFFQYHCSSRI